jgi:aspartate racemase
MRTQPLKQKTIGILGGCSNVATAEYYKLLNAAANAELGGWDIAETLIAGMNFGNIEAFVRQDDWAALERYMTGKIDGLVAAGADLILCVSNTLHRAFVPIMEKRDVPFIHIAGPTGEAIKAAKLTRVALFGTKPVMAQDYLRAYYRERFAIDIVVPNEEEQTEIDAVIFDELVKNVVCATSKQQYLTIADRLARDEGAEGLIMGCTEFFLLIGQSDRPNFPMFNTTKLHCEAAIRMALTKNS